MASPTDRFRRVHDDCRDVALPEEAGRSPELPLPPAGLTLRAPAGGALTVRLRRFADGYATERDAAPGERFFPL